ncbi:hypothetical protein HPB49_023314 [Dermacentor silvarum]|uniref:Uncharacterized protein n=1 Tax=Dermacentor silvarum TaxID=543639 RepID=A0ACB8CTY8_DERSI|nr:hypothetical protein HPB49_023314 [Dermacentor silvarum]
MTRELFAEWLDEFDQDMMTQNRKVLLVLDSCLAQLSPTMVTIFYANECDMDIIHVLMVLIALDRADADVPLCISSFTAVEMLKAA